MPSSRGSGRTRRQGPTSGAFGSGSWQKAGTHTKLSAEGSPAASPATGFASTDFGRLETFRFRSLLSASKHAGSAPEDAFGYWSAGSSEAVIEVRILRGIRMLAEVADKRLDGLSKQAKILGREGRTGPLRFTHDKSPPNHAANWFIVLAAPPALSAASPAKYSLCV